MSVENVFQRTISSAVGAGGSLLQRVAGRPRVTWFMRFLAIMGPGIIVLTGDNDVGGFSTYSAAGQQYGLGLLWVMLLLFPVTYYIQEMVVRLGCATGQGHAHMIYKRFGKFWGTFSLLDLILVNFMTAVTEFVGIQTGLHYFGIPSWIAVAIGVAFLVGIVVTGAYKRWENAVLFLVLVNFLVIPPALAMHVRAGALLPQYVHFQLPGGLSAGVIYTIIALVGTTIAPWQIFFQQSAIADKGLRIRDIPLSRLDLKVGNFIVQIGALCMIVVAAKLYFGTHLQLNDPSDVAYRLAAVVHPYLGALWAIALVNAGFIAGTANTLANAWALGEVAGWKHSLNVHVLHSPLFYGFYAVLMTLAGAVTLVPGAPLQVITVGVQVLAGIILPTTVVFLNLLLNDRELLGPNLINRPWNNWVNWTIIAVLYVLSGILAAQIIAPNLFPKG